MNAPPASTDWSCAQSPTSSTFAPASAASAASRSRAKVPASVASSMITSCPFSELRPSAVVLVQPLGGVLTPDAEVFGEHLSGDSARGEADDAALPVLRRPGCLQSVHGGGLAGAGRTDEKVDLPPGHGNPRERLDLLSTQQVLLASHALEDIQAD